MQGGGGGAELTPHSPKCGRGALRDVSLGQWAGRCGELQELNDLLDEGTLSTKTGKDAFYSQLKTKLQAITNSVTALQAMKKRLMAKACKASRVGTERDE